VDSVSFHVDLMLYARMRFRLCLNLKICVCFIWICGLFFEIVRFYLDLCFTGVVLIISNWIFDFLLSFPLLITDL
jgi:hypothetical protein